MSKRMPSDATEGHVDDDDDKIAYFNVRWKTRSLV